MEKEYVQDLIILIGGAKLPEENKKAYLARVSLYIGVDYYSLRDAYYEGRMSKNTREKLEMAAQHARRPHELIAYTQRQLTIWEKDAERYRPWIDAARAFLVDLRREPEAGGGLDCSERDCDGAAEATAAAGLEAAAAKA